MKEIVAILSKLSSTPLPSVLAAGGLIFILLAVTGGLPKTLPVPSTRQKWLGALGGILLVMGVAMFIVGAHVETEPQPPTDPTFSGVDPSKPVAPPAQKVKVRLKTVDPYEQGPFKESNHAFSCPKSMVLVARKHEGDDNGNTYYRCASLQDAGAERRIEVDLIEWSAELQESNHHFEAPPNRVIVGRQHRGDENGPTRYQFAKVQVDGMPAQVVDRSTSAAVRESSGTWLAGSDSSVVTGRSHTGDENGLTRQQHGSVEFETLKVAPHNPGDPRMADATAYRPSVVRTTSRPAVQK